MKKKGSAILTVIAAVVVLLILALSFMGSQTERAGISKSLSDEKKTEALAESAADLVLSFIRKNCNNQETGNELYYLLRAPLKYKESSGSGNISLDVSAAPPVEDLSSYINFDELLGPVIDEIGWTGKVNIEAKCELCSAEAFTPANSNYKVPTINYDHIAAEGNSAKFLDSNIDSIAFTSESTTDWQPSRWELRLKFPSGNPLREEKSFDVDVELIFGIDIAEPTVTLEVTRAREEDTVININADTGSIIDDVNLGDFDIQEKLDNSHYFPNVRPVNMEGLQNYVMGSPNTPDYDFSGYVSEISSRMDEVKNAFSAYNISSSDFADNNMVIEKGAILRITTTVTYNKSESQKIVKKLTSEIPFKASDVQPIAPEYTFFVANSNLLADKADIANESGGFGKELGKPIDMNKGTPGSQTTPQARKAMGRLVVHNLQHKNGKPTYNLDPDRVPGMVRINTNYGGRGDPTTKVRNFLGVFEEPETTELNKFFTPFNPSKAGDYDTNKFNTVVSFLWEDTEPKERYHEIEFPLLFEFPNHPPASKVAKEGVLGFIDVFHDGNFNIISVPTLLFGNAHMEYPLGINAEGPMTSVYSRIRIMADPDASVSIVPPDVDDETKIYYDFEPVSTYSKNSTYPFEDKGDDTTTYEPAPYGMQGHESFKPDEPWKSNDDFRYMPANCYDALQYAKKATRYYETAGEFLADMNKNIANGGLKNSNVVELNGVFYIKSGVLNLPDFTYQGNGLIVSARSNIVINGNIKRVANPDGSNSTLGIIARTGKIAFAKAGCEVHASCFSNNSPSSPGQRFSVYGNLVTNDFVRYWCTDIDIFYDNTLTSVTPLATLRKAGKFEPKRYVVAFADNWSRFTYEKE